MIPYWTAVSAAASSDTGWCCQRSASWSNQISKNRPLDMTHRRYGSRYHVSANIDRHVAYHFKANFLPHVLIWKSYSHILYIGES